MAIAYYNDQCSYRFTQRRLINRWLKEVAKRESYRLTDLGVIFCSAARILEMNREFLGHDYFTDIITFDDSDLELTRSVAGELYIDVETVADNASKYDTTPLREMHRILSHGVLHLCGQGDKTPEDSLQMRAKEDLYLALLDEMTVSTAEVTSTPTPTSKI
ncbi:MAG: rRNA maturation RNase YbeY [Rikenellaceae bacterium]